LSRLGLKVAIIRKELEEANVRRRTPSSNDCSPLGFCFQIKLSSANKQLDIANSRAARLHDRARGLAATETNLVTSETRLSTAQGSLAVAEQHVAELQAELVGAGARADALRSKLCEVEEQSAAAQGQLRAEIHELKSTLSRSEKQVKEFSDEGVEGRMRFAALEEKARVTAERLKEHREKEKAWSLHKVRSYLAFSTRDLTAAVWIRT
jgi:chromosome segregation ATPase